MRRPQSAKPGFKGHWAQGSESELQQQQNLSKAPFRKNLKLIKPDLTTNDFARILPKKIYQDKERLYSEALQLKQNLNETLQQNIRLKTRITILQKEKDKMTKHLEINRDNSNPNKANSRVNVYNNKSNDKENLMIRNLKKMVRQGKQENEFLKQENAKIKRAIKYTKINELQIERKMLQDQNKRVVTLLEQINDQLINQDSLEKEFSDLKRKLEYQEEVIRQISDSNQKYEEQVQELKDKLANQTEKYQNRENKLQRDFALTKRKLNETLKQTEELKKQLNNLRLQSNGMKPQSNLLKGQSSVTRVETQRPKLTRPMSSNPYKSQGGLVGVRLTTQSKKQQQNKETQQMKNIQLQNQKLKDQLNRAKIKLQEMNLQQVQINSEKRQDLENKTQKQNHSSKPTNQINQKTEIQSQLSPQKRPKVQGKSQQPHQFQDSEEKYDNDQDNYDDNYENQFEDKDEFATSKKNNLESSTKQPPKEHTEIDQYRKDFEEEEEEEPLYVKDDSPKKKKQNKQGGQEKQSNKDQKNDQKNESSKKKKEKKENTAFKPNKKILAEIKELLTYRMKAQRYPYEELKRDIEEAKEKQFSLTDLKGMFINEPFYLTEKYAHTLIQYCYQHESPKQSQTLLNETLLLKLRKVIDNFVLLDEKEEEEMLLRIAEMVTEYPEELETAFQKIKNGEQTVSRQDLIDMFQNLELEQKYIELIIQELSLCSADLQHLNFIGFFERFYVENMSGLQNGQIDEEQMESSSEEVSKNLKSKDLKKLKEIKAQFEDNGENLVEDDGERISLGNGQDNYNDENGDIVSDDGPI